MGKFDMSSMFADLSVVTQNTLTDNIKMIDIDELHESADNFFVMERIEEFADTILGQGGIKDNLLVRPLESGGYEVISGHRRRAAIKYLIDKGENVSRLLPCLVQSYADESAKMLDLILMNVSARKLSDSELMKSYEILNDLLHQKKEKGESFGRLRETLGEMLGISPAQVGKLQNIEKYAIPEIKDAVTNGEISLSTANEIAKLSDEEQVEIASKPLDEIKPKQIKKKVDTNINSEKQSAKVRDSEHNSDNLDNSADKVDTNINYKENPDVFIQDIDKEENKTQDIEFEENEVDTNINAEIIGFIEKLYDYTENGDLPKLSTTWWSAVNKLYNTEY